MATYTVEEPKYTVEEPKAEVKYTVEEPKVRPNWLQLYLREAQPAFKLATARPQTLLGAELKPEEIEKTTQASWADLLREAYPRQATTWGGQIRTGLGGGLLDIGTRPSSYIGAYAIPKITGAMVTKMASTPGGRAFLTKYFPTFAKDVLAKTAPKITPITPTGAVAKPEVTPKMVGSLRLSKFPPETRPVIQQAQPIKPPVRTFAEQRITAEQLKSTINLDTLKPQDILNAEMRRASALKVIDNAKSALASNKLEDMQMVYGQIQKINNLHNEAGRLLGSLRDPLFQQDDEAIKLISDGLQKVIPESKESLVKFFKMATQPRLWDKFMEYRTASLLTSPYTHERNIIGNTIGRLFKIPERVISGGADAIRSFVTRQPRERYATEAMADIVGSGRGIRLGTKNALRAFMNEEFSMSSRISEAVRFHRAIPGVVGKIIRLPFRALNAMDEFFSTWASTSDLYAQAYRQAIKEGSKDVISRTAQLVRKPTLEMLANASQEALYQTYRQPLGAGGKAIQSALVKTKVGKFIVPFFRTPVNLFKWTFDRSPLGLYKFATKSFYQLSAGEKADVVGKVALGQLVSASMAYEAWQGNITGRLSNNKAEREALMRQGIMPYSVKIGNKYISYRSFEPISSWMGLISNSVEQWKEKDEEPTYGQVASVMGETVKFMKDQPFLMGISDLFNAMDDPDRYGQRFVQNMTTSVTTPTGVGYVARLFDPTIREPETIPEAIKARIPYLSKKVAPKLDVWGRPITKEGTLMERALNPAGVVTLKPDLTEQELLSLEKFPQKITKKYRGIPLSIDERNIITRVEGGITKRILDKLITLPEYQKLNTFEREKEVDRVIREIRTETRRAFLEKKIINDLRSMTNREDKIKYIQDLIEKKIIKTK